jgi:hypothetical protein
MNAACEGNKNWARTQEYFDHQFVLLPVADYHHAVLVSSFSQTVFPVEPNVRC